MISPKCSGISGKNRRERNRGAGFTLLELIVVITVIGVTLGLILPRTAGFLYQDDYRKSLRDLAVTIGHARNKAILTGTIWALVIDPDTNGFWAAPVTYERPANSPESELVTKLGKAEQEGELAGEIFFQEITVAGAEDDSEKVEGKTIIRILPRGLTEPTAIVLGSPDEPARTLRIKAFGGRLELDSEEGDDGFGA